MAESLHTLLTSVSTFLSLLTLKAYRPNGYPIYGQGKREVVITFLLIAILGFAGLNLIGLSAQQLIGVCLGDTRKLSSSRQLAFNAGVRRFWSWLA
jgi:hypothetical protein